MNAVIKNIQVPKEWEITGEYDSHRPLLYLALEKTGKKSVCEFGAGFGSTPLLQEYCIKNERRFFTYETDEKWCRKFDNVTLMRDYDLVVLSEWHKQGVLFIDSAPGDQRKWLIKKHANNADVIIVHDTEPIAQNIYGIKEVLNSFKYRLDFYPDGLPGTTALSNTINVTEWTIQL